MNLQKPFRKHLLAPGGAKDEAILVSNAQSRCYTESLVSGASSPKMSNGPLSATNATTNVKFLQYSVNPSPAKY